MDETKETNPNLLSLKKTHLIIGCVLALLTPLASGYTSYQSAVKEVGAARIEAKFGEARLGLERDFVRKSEFDPMQNKINKIAEDVAEIKGYLRSKR